MYQQHCDAAGMKRREQILMVPILMQMTGEEDRHLTNTQTIYYKLW